MLAKRKKAYYCTLLYESLYFELCIISSRLMTFVLFHSYDTQGDFSVLLLIISLCTFWVGLEFCLNKLKKKQIGHNDCCHFFQTVFEMLDQPYLDLHL